MSDPLSGDAAYHQHLEEIAKRNLQASRDGKARREALETDRAAKRRESDARELARFMAERPKP
jgi:hypothetical protein